MSVNSNAPIQFTFAGLPEGYCFTGFNRFALDIVAAMSGYVPGQYSVIIDSESEPAAADRGKLWFKREAGGAPTGRLYAYFNGSWVCPNPEAANSDAMRWVEMSESDVWSYDGGDGTDPSTNPPTATTGAMWEVNHDYDFKMPLGAGTSPVVPYTLSDGSTVNFGGTVVTVGNTGGSQYVQLDETQIPDDVPCTVSLTDFATGPNIVVSGGGSDRGIEYSAASENHTGEIEVVTDGEGNPHPNLPNYRCGFFVRRTSRQFYVA